MGDVVLEVVRSQRLGPWWSIGIGLLVIAGAGVKRMTYLSDTSERSMAIISASEGWKLVG